MQLDDLDDLAGEILRAIDVDEDNNQILLTTESGREILLHHCQSCCEKVRILDTEGEWRQLLGKPLLDATHHEQQADTARGSETRTALTFCVDGATVISRWIGKSNGYYSESVHIRELTEPCQP